jgi:hypothetical protein
VSVPVVSAASGIVPVGVGLRGFWEVFAIPMGISGVRDSS